MQKQKQKQQPLHNTISAIVGYKIVKPWEERFPDTALAIARVEVSLARREAERALRERLARDPVARAEYQAAQIRQRDELARLMKSGLTQKQQELRAKKAQKLEAERQEAQAKKAANASQGASPNKAQGGGKKKK